MRDGTASVRYLPSFGSLHLRWMVSRCWRFRVPLRDSAAWSDDTSRHQVCLLLRMVALVPGVCVCMVDTARR